MKKEIIKIMSVLVVLLFIATISFASDINMNLQTNGSNSITTNTQNNVTTNEVDQEEELTNQNTATSNLVKNPNSTSITNASSIQDDSLGLANILNILLIVVGVVLILLGIAILIRLRS